MSPKKLTDATKTEILKLYRETDATTSTLADRYEVSSSTISRFLKSYLTETEYEDLIQQKRLARTPRRNADGTEEDEGPETPAPVAVAKQLSLEVSPRAKATAEPAPESPPGKSIKLYKGKKTPPKVNADRKDEEEIRPAPVPEATREEQPAIEKDEDYTAEKITLKPVSSRRAAESKSLPPDDDEEDLVNVTTLEEMFGEDIDDLDDDEDEEDWDDDEDDGDYGGQSFTPVAQLQVLPLSAASLPKTCYLVIDRFAELITRPLKDFAELGKIPPQEVQQRTLPIFDSHRVARRFSKRRERVIKVPDGQLLQKVYSHLEAKGITRLLIDGRIYTLTP